MLITILTYFLSKYCGRFDYISLFRMMVTILTDFFSTLHYIWLYDSQSLRKCWLGIGLGFRVNCLIVIFADYLFFCMLSVWFIKFPSFFYFLLLVWHAHYVFDNMSLRVLLFSKSLCQERVGLINTNPTSVESHLGSH